METITRKLGLKIAGLTLALSSFAFVANAQNTTTAEANLGVIKNSAVATTPVANGTVRLVDNKGTIKYLQVKNGLTAVTNTATDGTGVTTTWQLGGTLTNDTYIDLGSGVDHKLFSLDNLSVVAPGTAAATTASAAHGAANPAGWTVLVRDEVTGEVKKMLASDFLQVQAGQTVIKVNAAFQTTPAITLPSNVPSDISKVSVYRNGAKLVGGSVTPDYSLAADVVTLNPANDAWGEWALFVGDVIEVQWIK